MSPWSGARVVRSCVPKWALGVWSPDFYECWQCAGVVLYCIGVALAVSWHDSCTTCLLDWYCIVTVDWCPHRTGAAALQYRFGTYA